MGDQLDVCIVFFLISCIVLIFTYVSCFVIMGNKIWLLQSRRLITVQTLFALRHHAMWVYVWSTGAPPPLSCGLCFFSNQRCASGCVVDRRICNREVAGFETRPGLLRTFHPSWVGKWVPAVAGKAKAGMAHSDCGKCGSVGAQHQLGDVADPSKRNSLHFS